MTIREMIESCLPKSGEAEQASLRRWDSIAKPLHGLGLLEDAVVKICAVSGDVGCPLSPRGVAVFCADNGVVAQGVTQTGQEVTSVVARNMTLGDTSVCQMAALAGAEVFPVDVGMAARPDFAGILHRSQGLGTADMSLGPAMTRAQAEGAIGAGYELARDLARKGYRLLCAGEMGIGNTTTSSAVASVLLGRPPRDLTGRGAGLTTQGLLHKVEVIERSIARNRPDPSDPVDVLAKVGGFDIGAMAGFYLGASASRVPVLLDGFISAVAALAACRLAPVCRDGMIASHCSGEPGARLVLEELGLSSIITAGLSLGEGTGAVAAIPLLEMAAAVYRNMSTFGEIKIQEYRPLA